MGRRIRVPEVRVIGADGSQVGILPTHEALKLAEEQATGTVVTLPTAQELQVPVESQLIVEYMSR